MHFDRNNLYPFKEWHWKGDKHAKSDHNVVNALKRWVLYLAVVNQKIMGTHI